MPDRFNFNAISYVTIATVISRVKQDNMLISMREDINFSRESSPGISLVFI